MRRDQHEECIGGESVEEMCVSHFTCTGNTQHSKHARDAWHAVDLGPGMQELKVRTHLLDEQHGQVRCSRGGERHTSTPAAKRSRSRLPHPPRAAQRWQPVLQECACPSRAPNAHRAAARAAIGR